MALGGVVSVAAVRLVTGDGLDGSGKVGNDASKIGGLKGRILPDREVVITTACLSIISSAGEAALAIIDLGTTDSGTTVADAVVLKTSIAEAVALALSDTLLNSHVVLVLAGAVDECTVTAARSTVLEASSGDKWLERVETRWVFSVPCLSDANQGESRTSDDSSKREHGVFCYQMKGSIVADKGRGCYK